MLSETIKLTTILTVRTSTIHGCGLFSKTTLKKDSFLGTYFGEKVDDDSMHVLWAELEDGSWEGRDGKNILRYLNHSREPSCEFIGFDLYALRDIEAGEELTIHYGPGFDRGE
jgi:SET domain-containing protein